MNYKGITCPKCGYERLYTEEWVKSGIVISKYIEEKMSDVLTRLMRPEPEHRCLLKKTQEFNDLDDTTFFIHIFDQC